MLQKITPKLNNQIVTLIKDRHLLFNMKRLCRGPLHLLLPNCMDDNVHSLRHSLDTIGVDYHIFFAHKATKSSAFLRQALKLKLGIDVASKDELCHALAMGFRGEQTECTGIKNDSFLQLALLQGCLLVADSIPELIRIARIKQGLGINKELPILARLSNVSIPGRVMQNRISRFGIAQNEFGALFNFFKENLDLSLHGFHFHNDEREGDIRAGQLEGMLNLIMDAYKAGFAPSIVNIGGGLRRQQLMDTNQWTEYVARLEEDLVKGNRSNCWRGFAYGMRLNDRGKVMGRTQAIAIGTVPDFSSVMQEMFLGGDIEGKNNGEFIKDNGLVVYLEPGQALLEQCAISLFEVIEIKNTAHGDMLVVVDGNMYNLSVSMKEYVMDPILINISDDPTKQPCECFIVGNLCREEDFLLKRKVQFNCIPEPGSLICFVNTAAYRIDFEDASPHQHPVGSRLVASSVGSNDWQFSSEDTYDSFANTQACPAINKFVQI